MISNCNIDKLLDDVKWTTQPDKQVLAQQLHTIAVDIVKGQHNRLYNEQHS